MADHLQSEVSGCAGFVGETGLYATVSEDLSFDNEGMDKHERLLIFFVAVAFLFGGCDRNGFDVPDGLAALSGRKVSTVPDGVDAGVLRDVH